MGNLNRAESALAAVSHIKESPAWYAALEHYRDTVKEYWLTDLTAEIDGFVEQIDHPSGELKIFLVWLYKELDRMRP